jgi:hypothetical protein
LSVEPLHLGQDVAKAKGHLGALCEELRAVTRQGVKKQLPLRRADPATAVEVERPRLL